MLVVASSRVDFYHAVADALRSICPTCRVAVSSNGVVRLDSGTSGGGRDRYEAGCPLVHALVAATGTTRIMESRHCRYDQDRRIVEWNPSEAARGVTELGREEGPPAVNLAHELIHAHRDVFGTSDVGLLEEYETVRSENEIRHELGLPLRVEYGGVVVPSIPVAS